MESHRGKPTHSADHPGWKSNFSASRPYLLRGNWLDFNLRTTRNGLEGPFCDSAERQGNGLQYNYCPGTGSLSTFHPTFLTNLMLLLPAVCGPFFAALWSMPAWWS